MADAANGDGVRWGEELADGDRPADHRLLGGTDEAAGGSSRPFFSHLDAAFRVWRIRNVRGGPGAEIPLGAPARFRRAFYPEAAKKCGGRLRADTSAWGGFDEVAHDDVSAAICLAGEWVGARMRETTQKTEIILPDEQRARQGKNKRVVTVPKWTLAEILGRDEDGAKAKDGGLERPSPVPLGEEAAPMDPSYLDEDSRAPGSTSAAAATCGATPAGTASIRSGASSRSAAGAAATPRTAASTTSTPPRERPCSPKTPPVSPTFRRKDRAPRPAPTGGRGAE